MAEFPFDPIVVGNLCKDCCPKCIDILNDKDAKCCNVSGQKQCYSPKKECKECIGTFPAQTIIEYCKTGENLAKGKTSCCNGECYSNVCFECVNNELKPKFDTSIYGCCSGPSGGKYRLNTCKQCDENDNIEDLCSEIEKCCEGECITDDDPCKKCTGEDPGILIELCKDSADGPDCCKGICWNSEKDNCRLCDLDLGLKDKEDCNCCTSPDGSKKCCSKSKKEKCCTSGDCISSSCEECP